MKTKIVRFTVCTLSCLVFGVQFATAEEASDSMEMHSRLLKSLEAFAEQNELTMEQTYGLLADLTTNQELFSVKGGIGLVSENVFVVVNDKDNRLILGKDEEWVGRTKINREVVLLAGGMVVAESPLENANDLIVVVFQHDSVKIYNMKDGSGGYYERR